MAAIDYSDWAAKGDEDASFDKAPFDHEGGRKKLTDRITRTLRQLNNEPVTPQGGKDFSTLHNNGVHYKPTLNGHPLPLPGLPEGGVRIHRESLKTKLAAFARDVEHGHFDKAIEDIMSRPKPVNKAKPRSATSGTRASSGKKYPEDHPANTDPKWSSYTQGEKNMKGKAYHAAKKA